MNLIFSFIQVKPSSGYSKRTSKQIKIIINGKLYSIKF